MTDRARDGVSQNSPHSLRLRSGRYFNLLDPHPDQFTLTDIAGALAKLCRYGGQINQFYSVAEHCVWCARVARYDGRSNDIVKAVFLHDAAEAFCGDVIRPLKLLLSEYKIVEKRVESAIAQKYGVDFAAAAEYIDEIDLSMMILEKNTLFSHDDVPWVGEERARPLGIIPMGFQPPQAEGLYLEEAEKLKLIKLS